MIKVIKIRKAILVPRTTTLYTSPSAATIQRVSAAFRAQKNRCQATEHAAHRVLNNALNPNYRYFQRRPTRKCCLIQKVTRYLMHIFGPWPTSRNSQCDFLAVHL